MAVTRSMKKANNNRRKASQKKSQKRSKNSPCRGKGPAVCRSLSGCKYASGKKRNFCRRTKNKSAKNNRNNRNNKSNKRN
jgi:hypothetical protein